MTPIIALAVLIGLPFLLYIMMYNGLVSKKNSVENAFGGMDAQLKKRYDLIPNLISTVKEYMSHEKELLTKITELRSKALKSGDDANKKVEIDNQISHALTGLMVQVENYPDLKASESFVILQQSMNEVEAQISAARRNYNTCVTEYNNSIEMFPSNIIAKTMSYQRKEVFKIEEFERKNVNAQSLFNS